MPDFNVGAYLAGDVMRLHGVPSEKYPEGQTYIVQPPCAEDEIRLRRIMQLQAKNKGALSQELLDEYTDLMTGDDGEPIDVTRKLLGDTWQQLTDDGVSPTRIDMLGQLVVTNYGMSSEAARLVVSHAEGEALAASANRATRRAAAKPAKKGTVPRKHSSSSTPAGSRSARTSTAANTPAVKATSRGSATSTGRKSA